MKSLPYTVHTNRELGLLLSGDKKFAQFHDRKDMFPDALGRYLRLFDRHVEEGSLLRRDHVYRPEQSAKIEMHRIMFALPDEEWRFEAFLDLWDETTWGPAQERREGELYGYEDWMNDHWIALKYSH